MTPALSAHAHHGGILGHVAAGAILFLYSPEYRHECSRHQGEVRPEHGPVRADDLRSLPMIKTLVAFDTTSRDTNLALIDLVRDYLESHGVASTLSFDDDGAKPTFSRPCRPRKRHRRHCAVGPYRRRAGRWPALGERPFESRPRRQLYARGIADMKSFFAVAGEGSGIRYSLAQRPIHLALTYDEEVGCIGVRSLVAAWRRARSSRGSASSASRR